MVVSPRRGWWLLGVALGGAACSADTSEATRVTADARPAPVDATAPGVDAPAWDVAALPERPPPLEDAGLEAATDGALRLDASRMAYCEGTGPAIRVGVPGGAAVCAGRLAERVFRYGLCTCTDLSLAGFLRTDSFDSGRSAMMTGERGGAVGVNGAYTIVGYSSVGDMLTVSGTDALRLVGAHRVRGDLNLAGSVEVLGTLDVERNARVRGNITGLGTIHIRGNLQHGSGALALAVMRVDGSRSRGAVDVAPPCACRADELVDVAAIVRAARTDNHNAEVGFDPRVFNAVVGIQTVDLPCGRFWAERVAGLGGITLRVQGRTALFIDGDFDLAGAFDVDLGPMGELDVFVGGSITGAGYLRLGRSSRPAAVRFYVAGDRGFTLAGASGFRGNLYAPRAPVTIAGYMNLFGSIFAQRIATGGDLDVHYDRAVVRAGERCPDAPMPEGCRVCGGQCRTSQACVAGRCAMCRTDEDCCAPLVCETRTGQCLPIPP